MSDTASTVRLHLSSEGLIYGRLIVGGRLLWARIVQSCVHTSPSHYKVQRTKMSKDESCVLLTLCGRPVQLQYTIVAVKELDMHCGVHVLQQQSKLVAMNAKQRAGGARHLQLHLVYCTDSRRHWKQP